MMSRSRFDSEKLLKSKLEFYLFIFFVAVGLGGYKADLIGYKSIANQNLTVSIRKKK